MEVNVLVLNVSLEEGMAGSMRVRNLVDPLVEAGSITLSNLALTHINEKNKIGKQGIIDNIKYLYIGYHNPAYLNQVYTFYKAGTRFLISQYKIDSKNILYNYGYPDIKNIF